MDRQRSIYNTTICTKLNGQIFKDYFKTVHKDRCDLMCSFDAYDKENVTITSDASSGDGITMPSTSSKESIYSLGHTIYFIENWLQLFDGDLSEQN